MQGCGFSFHGSWLQSPEFELLPRWVQGSGLANPMDQARFGFWGILGFRGFRGFRV